ncbi:hypothetical protein COO60DRAFT_1476709 [Scenedesmus sp. NREL 46B-D3]|nr:hypothetical protein COO60DRAFT_1476709 [Scenedesmus sp. NREL 46B-D3]
MDSGALQPAAAAAAAGAGAAGPVPGMPDMSAMMTPEMMQAASQMMAGMKPEDFAAMSSMMGGAGAAGGAPGAAAGAAGLPEGMAGMLGSINPAMLEGMLTSLQAMDEDSLKQMLMGMCGNEQQAAVMASQMKKISPGQMRMLTKAAGVVQGGVQAARKAREWLAGNVVLVAAVVLLLVAILLRWYGIM